VLNSCGFLPDGLNRLPAVFSGHQWLIGGVYCKWPDRRRGYLACGPWIFSIAFPLGWDVL